MISFKIININIFDPYSKNPTGAQYLSNMAYGGAKGSFGGAITKSVNANIDALKAFDEHLESRAELAKTIINIGSSEVLNLWE